MSPCVVCGCPSKGAERCPDHEREYRERRPHDSRRLVGDEPDRDSLLMRERLADDRERRADERDDRADVREAASADRDAEVDTILAAAEQRDRQADARDHRADRRDVAAALDVAVFGPAADSKPSDARRMAAKDRGQSKTDRSAAHIDRYLLSGAEPTAVETEDDPASAE